MNRFWKTLFLCVATAMLIGVPQAQAQYDNTNTVLGQFDAFGTMNPVFTTDYLNGIPVANAYNFSANQGAIVFDETRHRLFVADRGNNRVLVYDTDVNNNLPYGSQPTAVLGQTNFTTRTAATSQTALSAPAGLALDEAGGRLFVADLTNARVMVFNVSGAITNNMAASNYLGGGVDFNTITRASATYATTALTQFHSPYGLAYDTDTNFLYVSDFVKSRITIFDVTAITNGESARSEVLGDASGNFLLSGPKKVDIDTVNNRLFLADSSKNRVLVYDIAALVSQEDPVNVLGQPDFATVTAAVTQAKMNSPQGVSYKTNQLAVSMSNRVLIYDVTAISNGENATNVLGQPDFTTANTGTTSLSTINNGNDIDWVGTTQLLTLDSHRVVSYEVTSITDGEAATNVLGQVDPTLTITTNTISANGAGSSRFGFEEPTAVKVDTTANRLYVSDYFNDRILVYNLDSTTKLPLDNEADYVLGQTSFIAEVTSSVTDSTFQPWGIALDETNQRLFVADENGHRVLVFDVSTITNGEAAINVLGQPNFTTSSTATNSFKMDTPHFVEYNAEDEWLFVGETGNNRVTVFDLSDGITNGMSARKVIGQEDFISSNCNLTADGLCDAWGQMVFDEDDRNLYITDSFHNRVLVYTLPADITAMSNGMDANFVIGQAGFTTDVSTPVETRFDTPYGLALTASDMLLVYDCFNYRILAYDVSTLANDPAPLGVIGQSNFTNNTQLAVTANGLGCWEGEGMDFDDASGHLYVADIDYHRVMVYDMARITTLTLPDGNTSTSYSEAISSTQLNGTGTLTLESGTLPPGLSLSSPNITGTPTTNGIYEFTLRLTDDSGGIGDFFTTQEYSVNIGGVSPTPTPTPTPTPSSGLYPSTGDVLGQFDVYNSTDPVDTTGYRDGIPVPNAYNFDSNGGKIVVDETRHRLFVSDSDNNRILVYELDSNNTLPYGEAPDYVLGQSDFISGSANTTQSGLSSPKGIVLNESEGLLFVADAANGRVMVFDVSGYITNNMNAVRYLGAGGSFTGVSLPSNSYETGNLNAFYFPTGLAYDTDTNRLYVSDGIKDRITVFSMSTITNGESALSTVLGDASGNFLLDGPRGMELDTVTNRLYVSDLFKNRVLVYDIATVTLQEDPINVLGQPDFATIDAGVTQSKIFGPHDVSYRSSGTLLAVALSGGRVITYDVAAITNGENAVNVLGQADFVTASSTISLSFTDNVNGVEWVGSSQLLALDQNRLLSFDVTSITDGEAATNVLGQVNPLGVITTDTRIADGTMATAYGMDLPRSVKVDSVNNRLYVADTSNFRILVYDLDATTKLPLDNQADYVLGQSDFVSSDAGVVGASVFQPWGLELDITNNRLFVSDHYAERVLVFDVSTITNGEAAVNVLGQADFDDVGTGLDDTSFNSPHFMAYDSVDQWLFVGDAYNYRVLVFDLSGGITNGMAASKVIGQPDFVTSGCNLTIDGVCDMEGELEFDAVARRLYLADPYGNRVLVYTIPSTMGAFSNGMDASFVIGQADFVTDDYTPVETRFNNLYGVDLTAKGMLLVHDCFNYRILAYDVTNLSNDPTPIGVIGQADFSEVTELTIGPDNLSCDYAQGIDFDDAGKNLYVADSEYHRVVSYHFASITTPSLPDGAVGVSYSETLAGTDLSGSATFSIQSGSLPTGLNVVSPSITGTPTVEGLSAFTVRLADVGGAIGYFFTSQDFSITVTPDAPTPTPTPTPDPSATPTPTPSTSPTPSPTATPTPSQVTAGAAGLISPTGGSIVSAQPSFSWENPAEPENVGGYKLIIDGVDFFGTLPLMNIETSDYILVFNSSSQTFLLQSKKTISAGTHSWYLISVSTTGRETDSAQATFNVGGVTRTSGNDDDDGAGSGTGTGTASDPAEGGEDSATASAVAQVDQSPLPTPSTELPNFALLFTQPGDFLNAVTQLAAPVITAATEAMKVVNEVAKPAAPILPAVVSVVAPIAAAVVVVAQTGSGLISTNILTKLLQVLGLIGQGKPQGMVYDSMTNAPVAFALLTITSKDKTIQETAVTDVHGVYKSVKLAPGTYIINVSHQDFTFPTKKSKPGYLSQRDYYQGVEFTVTSAKTEQLFMIPVDSKIKRAQKKSLWMKVKLGLKRALLHKTEMTLGFFAFSAYMTWLHPSWLNMGLTGFYAVILSYLVVQSLRHPLIFGDVNGPAGKPLATAIIKFIEPTLNQLVAVVTSNDKGLFKAFVEKGKYQMVAIKPGYVWNQGKDVMSFNEITVTKPQKLNLKFESAQALYDDLFGPQPTQSTTPQTPPAEPSNPQNPPVRPMTLAT